MNDRTLNREGVDRQLIQARVALDAVLVKLRDGHYDEEAPLVIAIDFEQVLSHLCLAWHFGFRTEEELSRRNSEEYIELSNNVPNFGFNLTLMPGIDCETDALGRKLNREAVAVQLGEAKVALDECIRKVKAGDFDHESPLVMATDFQQGLSHLCLAWHFKNMTDEERAVLSQEDCKRLSNTVPNFGFGLKLMSGIEPEAETGAKGHP